MSGRRVVAAVAGAAVFFIWGWIYWGMLFAPMAKDRLINEDQILETIKAGAPEEGAYLIPSPLSGDMKDPAYAAKHEAGPLVHIFLRKQGQSPMDPAVMGMGFLHLVVAMGLALVLLSWSRCETYRGKVIFISFVGLTASVLTEPGNAIWWFHPWCPVLRQMGYDIVGWFLSGIVMARILPHGASCHHEGHDHPHAAA